MMEDSRIIELYWQRSENAIAETDRKYGAYCSTVAFNISMSVKSKKYKLSLTPIIVNLT